MTGVCLLLFLSLATVCHAGDSGAGTSADAAVSAPNAPARFAIWEYRVTGNTLLARTLVEQTVYPFLGPQRDLDDIAKAADALEKEYRKAGYPTVFVDIPEQKVVDGVVHLQVTEGRVDRLHVTGTQYHSPVQIREEVPALAHGEVPHMPAVKRQLAALGMESVDRRITPIMRAGRTPGTLDVELQVSDSLPLHGSLELTGNNTEHTSRLRAMGMLRYDNLWQKYHSLSLMYQVSPQRTSEVEVLAGTYVLPVGRQDRLALYGVHSNSKSQVASAGALAVIGKGSILGARLILPVTSTASLYQSGTIGLDYKDFDEGTELVGADTTTTPIRYLNFMARYEATLRGERQQTRFGAGINFSIRGLVSSQSQFDNKRAYSQADYAVLKADLKHERTLAHGLKLVGRLQGQLADSPLISNEQFSAGGANSVRGYYESQVLGDDAIFASVELQKDHLLGKADWLRSPTGLVFVDGAYLHLLDALSGETANSQLYGAGLGLRMQPVQHLATDLYLAWALKDAGSIGKGDLRADFRFAYEF